MSILIQVAVIAGYSSVRAGLQSLLSADEGLRLVGDARPGDLLACLFRDPSPAVVVLDTTGDSAGTDGIGRVLSALRRPPVAGVLSRPLGMVVLGESPERDIPRLAAASLTGWAYLSRDASGGEIIAAVRAVAAGLAVLSPSLAHALARTELRPRGVALPMGSDTVPGETLTPREIEVLALMAEGLPNKIIASRLGISLHTAKFHVAQILGKLDATSRTEAVTIGARRGYLVF